MVVVAQQVEAAVGDVAQELLLDADLPLRRRGGGEAEDPRRGGAPALRRPRQPPPAGLRRPSAGGPGADVGAPGAGTAENSRAATPALSRHAAIISGVAPGDPGNPARRTTRLDSICC